MARGVVVVVCSAASIASIGGHAAGRVRGSGTARVISAALAPARSATALRFISQASTAAAPSIAFFRITTGLNGTGALGDSGDASLSADGRFVTFTSDASNLVADPRHGSIKDVYVYDRATAQTTRESLGPSGAPATGASFAPVISTGGRFVAFWSVATDLVAPETEPGVSHVYVRDRQLAATTLVDVSSGGARGSGNAYQPAISSDGRFIAFWSLASNLVADDLNGCGDVFVRDLAAGTTERVSIPTPGFAPPCTFDSRDPSISADGRFVAFDGAATSAAPGSQLAVYVRDRATATTSLVSIDANSQPFRDFAFAPSINADGRFVVFQVNRPAGGSGLYMRDRAAGSTLGPLPGQFLSAHASADGRFVSYLTLDHDAFVIDAATGAVTAIAMLASDVSAVGGSAVVFSTRLQKVPADQDGFSDVYLATEAGDAAPGPPQGLAANSVGSTVTLTWSRPLSGGAVSSYVVEAGSTSAATDLATIDTQNPLPVFVAAGVGAGTYFVRVRGANAAGVGPPSNEIIVIVR